VAMPRAKQIIRGLDHAAAQMLAGEVMHAADAEGVAALLPGFRHAAMQ
jgi:hypothetical protein